MRKYINKLLIGAIAISASVYTSSCAGDYLDTAPTADIPTEAVFATTKNAAMAVNGIAQIMTSQQYSFSQGYAGENRIKSIYGEYPGKDFVYNQFATGWADIMNGTYYTRSETVYSSYPWYYYYTIIGNANTIIANIDNAEGLQSERDFIKAQALTFRAYGYTQLLQLYSKRWVDTNNGAAPGVILRLDESIGEMPLSTVKECYDQIYADCEDAIELYKSSGLNRKASDVWLPNLNVAYAVFARASLNRQDYKTALDNAKLARVGYPLMSNADYASGFCKPTSEWILGSYGDLTENQWYWSFGTQFSCNGYYSKAATYGAGAIDQELSDKIPNDDIRKKLFLTADKIEGFDPKNPAHMNQTNANIISTEKVDGKTQYTKTWESAMQYIESVTPAGLEPAYQSGYIYLGSHLKFWVFDFPGVSYLCHIRSSEMLLIEAEANYFLKNEKAAQDALVELNATSGRTPGYSSTKTGEALFQEIVDYRSLELWGEGFSWFDYKRWNKDIVRLGIPKGGNVHAATATKILANEHNNWTWSIPLAETDYNPLVKQ